MYLCSLCMLLMIAVECVLLDVGGTLKSPYVSLHVEDIWCSSPSTDVGGTLESSYASLHAEDI